MATPPPVGFEEGSRVRNLEARLRDPTPILEEIGRLMVGRTQAAFRNQGRGEFEWPPRMNPNVPGIIADLAKGTAVKSRRFEDRPALVDTSTLRNSIGFSVTDASSVEFGTVIPYADAHQEGKGRSVRVTETVKANLTRYLRTKRRAAKRAKKKGDAERAEQADAVSSLGFLFSVSSFEFQLQERPFVLFDDQDRADVVSLVERFIGGARGGSF